MNGNEQEVTTVSNQVHSASRMKVKKIAFIGLMGAVRSGSAYAYAIPDSIYAAISFV